MAVPSNRVEFRDFCLRELGHPVLKINCDEDQIQDRIDYALRYFTDYHMDSTDRAFFKYALQEKDFPDRVKDLFIHAGGNSYSNSDTITLGPPNMDGVTATVSSLTTDGNGAIISTSMANNGGGYEGTAPSVTINTSTGSGANVEARLGGWVTIPDNIMGVTAIFDLQNAVTNISNMFSIQYQIALNEIWSLSSYSMVPYYMTVEHLNLIQQLLVGQQPIRFNRYRSTCYLDMAWQRVAPGQFLIFDCYKIIDPNDFPKVWSDRWLQNYATAQIKKVWGNNMKKFGNMEMPGRVVFNGQKYYDEAVEEIAKLEQEMFTGYSLPPSMIIG